jgi:hypothetical protein
MSNYLAKRISRALRGTFGTRRERNKSMGIFTSSFFAIYY